ncbi:imidazole glycerol phosphate synthase subunit HisF [Muricauda ruestringensis]|uniref:imidazole glycerol-phosphate synthase n=1 Tax=Flagellimonas aurea TaxID=2915619 RepID=A0ABS3G0A9_9FLAO|nr:AglZ/HisF2 family acetamidino modification protein [Allomuricauda aurea]MAO18210.1 imidazole glycerol phosphate synthase subunit HisF [Allomuricauda sp.]MBC71021.1 imidazole glycerol phosphate synthase subunit HisF [Allomuricauda sp.]MBO0352836.1 imidazole glycerol phosphate synthase subunit HisF [Allomuricauda aurea]|tara:strand:+ start:15023 stop:15787 length:765 start_codon:yes stop_codon:yes gene_type:complete
MLRSRIIPCLLVKNKGLVKTVQFKEGKYVGDPINAVKIFNEKEVDELMVLDIDATKEGREPDFVMIENLANESRMPLCYGGGVKTVEHAKKIIHLGAEKVALSSAVIENPNLVTDIANAVGVQSVIVVLDVKKKGLFGKYQVYTNNGTKSTGKNPVDLAKKFESLGAGEIVVNSIDNDGVMKGYDINLIDLVRSAIDLPLTVLGGAGSLEDIKNVIAKYKIIGVAAGSLFVFKGKFKAVLINYPNKDEKRKLLS